MFQEDAMTVMMSKVSKELECPVCMEIVVPPVRQCVNGHVTCSACAETLANCSLCNQPILENNPTFINNLLAALPRPCKYSDKCKEFCVTGDEHENYCGFREILCRNSGCIDKVQVNKLKCHLEQRHQHQFVINSVNGSFHFSSLKPNEQGRLWYCPAMYDDKMFYIYFYKNSSDLCWNVLFESHFTKKPTQQYFVNVRLENGDFNASSTLAAIHGQDNGSSSQKEIVSNMVKKNEHSCMRVSQNLLNNIVGNSKSLSVKYSFFKK